MADSKDWENLVIETGVDSMMDYLAEHGRASTKEISKEIGVEKPRVEQWADALAEEKLVDKHHTITAGLVLEYTDENVKEAEKKKEEIEEDLNQRSEELKSSLEQKNDEVKNRREQLVTRKENLEDEDKEEMVQRIIERLEVIETRIDRRIEQDNLDDQTVDLILEVEEILKDVEQLIRKHLGADDGQKLGEKTEEAVDQVETVLEYAEQKDGYGEKEAEIRRQLKAMKKLQKNIDKAKSSDKDSKLGGLGSKFKSFVPISKKGGNKSMSSESSSNAVIDSSQKIREGEVPENTYEDLLDKNRITEVMRKISLIKNPDYSALLKAERNNRARPELVDYLEERVEDVR